MYMNYTHGWSLINFVSKLILSIYSYSYQFPGMLGNLRTLIKSYSEKINFGTNYTVLSKEVLGAENGQGMVGRNGRVEGSSATGTRPRITGSTINLLKYEVTPQVTRKIVHAMNE